MLWFIQRKALSIHLKKYILECEAKNKNELLLIQPNKSSNTFPTASEKLEAESEQQDAHCIASVPKNCNNNNNSTQWAVRAVWNMIDLPGKTWHASNFLKMTSDAHADTIMRNCTEWIWICTQSIKEEANEEEEGSGQKKNKQNNTI